MPARAPVGFPHPLVDESGPGWAASYTAAPVVGLGSGRSALIVDCVTAGVRPILVTRPDARLTFPLFQTLRVAGGVWLTRDDGGVLRHGGTGEPVDGLAVAAGLAAPAPLSAAGSAGWATARLDGRADGTARPAPRHVASDRAWVQVAISVHHAAREETTIGGSLERVLDALGAGGALSWGSAEPATLAWDRTAISGLARARMPAETRLIVAAPGNPAPGDPASGERGRGEVVHGDRETGDGRMTGVIRVSRGETGVIEETRAVVVVPDHLASDPEPVAALLAGIADRQQVLLATAWSMRGPADATIPAYSAAIPQPMAAVIGARAVRALELDVEHWERAHDARRVGNRRAPSLALDFGGDDTNWRRFAGAVSAIGGERMLSALLPAGVRHAP